MFFNFKHSVCTLFLICDDCLHCLDCECGFHQEFIHVVGFGSALNIETLVAAAERRETPIEVLGLSSL